MDLVPDLLLTADDEHRLANLTGARFRSSMIPGMPVKYDVCVIGSGAAGGVMTKELCEAGAKVVLLEAGREVKPAEYRSHCMPYEMQFRGLRGEKQEPFYPVDIQNTIRYEDSDGIGVDRIRVLGGRTVHWNAVVLRFAAQDFREHSVNGLEEDWPISYDELAPYYERVEQMIGVCGQETASKSCPRANTTCLPFRSGAVSISTGAQSSPSVTK